MKKYLLALVAVAVLSVALLAVLPVANAEQTTNYQNSEIYKFVESFINENPARSGHVSEGKAAQWLAEKFNQVLPQDCATNVVPLGSGNEVVSYNVVAKLTASNATDKQIIVGAHYDSIGAGANDNATGIAAMYFVMQNLVAMRNQLPVNVVFVAFGAEEQQLFGSYQYVDKMTTYERSNTLVMFNIDCIGNGDNLYVFAENKPTDLAKLILANATEAPAALQEKPYAKGIYPMDFLGFGYYEVAQGSDQTPFRLAGIPTVLFFSGNYVWGNYVESKNGINTMNTADDTLANLDKYCGEEFVRKVQTVVDVLTSTVTDVNFLPVAENATSQLLNNALFFNVWWAKLAVGVALVLLGVFAWLHHRKLQKQAIMGSAEVKSAKVFSVPSAEDIFSFDDSKSNVDDVFTFKK